MNASVNLEMHQVIEKVVARLTHLLEREARVGSSTPNRLSPKTPIASFELIEADQNEDEKVRDRPPEEIKPDRINDDEFFDRLSRLVDHLGEYASMIEMAQFRVAAKLHKKSPISVLHLTPEEITTHWDNGTTRPVNEQEIAELAGFLNGLRDHSERAISELNRLTAGHMGIERRPGKPAIRRGKEIAVMLLGFAVGLGLNATTNKLKAGKGSAIQAVTDAILFTQPPDDPAARAVFDQLPKHYDALANLYRARRRDEPLRSAFEANKRIGERAVRKQN